MPYKMQRCQEGSKEEARKNSLFCLRCLLCLRFLLCLIGLRCVALRCVACCAHAAYQAEAPEDGGEGVPPIQRLGVEGPLGWQRGVVVGLLNRR